MLFGGCSPTGASVVDKNIDMAQVFERIACELMDFGFVLAIGGKPLRVNALGLQAGGGAFEFVRLACAQYDAGAGLAQRLSRGAGPAVKPQDEVNARFSDG